MRREPDKLGAMLANPGTAECTWLCSGRDMFPAMLAAIEAASRAICLETYIYNQDQIGERFRAALVAARQRGVRVRVMVDALGSLTLPWSFWEPLLAVGGEVRLFNPLALDRLSIRDHRKLLVCDDQVAFVGGFNVGADFDGDGVTGGWCDLGLQVTGELPQQLARTFDEMFARADMRHKLSMLLRKTTARRTVAAQHQQLLLSGPGRGHNPLKRALREDLTHARDVQIIVAYFLPTWSIRRALMHVARRGGNVRLILAGKSDVPISQIAGQSLYRRLLRGGVQIYEYQPQILHAKLIIADNAVYVGSANLDQRSLNINYELMIRFRQKEMADQARAVFARTLTHCRQITLEEWRRSRTIWRRLKQRWAYWLLVRIDPYLAGRQWQDLPD
jgi:cardiolipin synthase A/B